MGSEMCIRDRVGILLRIKLRPITFPIRELVIFSCDIESMEKDVTLETRARQVLLQCVIITHITSNDSIVLV